ncbi:hypothetical protein [Marinibacterium sp. SX1]|uniref:hypothetical protein n=1 Tax=Marinibacterium sp. SX1 TaxID=3388424 RepID=UPI003D1723ED
MPLARIADTLARCARCAHAPCWPDAAAARAGGGGVMAPGRPARYAEHYERFGQAPGRTTTGEHSP